MGAYLSTFAPCVPTYLYAHAAGRRVQNAGDLCQREGGLHQHGAGRRLSRRRAARGDLPSRAHLSTEAAREMGIDQVELRRKRNMIQPDQFPLPDAGRSAVRRRQLPGRDGRRWLKAATGTASPRARAASEAKRQAARGLGISTYIEACGIAPSASWSDRSAPARASTRRPTVRVNPTGNGLGRLPARTATARATRPPSPRSWPRCSACLEGDRDRPRRHRPIQFGMGTYGSRSMAVGGVAIAKALREDHHQGPRRSPPT